MYSGYNCCQIGIELSKCVYLVSVGVKKKHTVDGHNQEFFQNAYLMVMPVETWATTKDNQRQNCENLCFCPLKCNGLHGKLN